MYDNDIHSMILLHFIKSLPDLPYGPQVFRLAYYYSRIKSTRTRKRVINSFFKKTLSVHLASNGFFKFRECLWTEFAKINQSW